MNELLYYYSLWFCHHFVILLFFTDFLKQLSKKVLSFLISAFMRYIFRPQILDKATETLNLPKPLLEFQPEIWQSLAPIAILLSHLLSFEL